MKYSWKDLTSSYTKKKRQMSSLWARIFSRPVSFVITYVLINLGMQANTVSVLSILCALTSCVFISIDSVVLRIIGVVLFALWHVLDCVDGNIARVKKESSVRGEYIDAISGYSASSFIYFAIGMAAFHTSHLLQDAYLWIVIGAVASMAEVFSRLVHNRFTVAMYREQYEMSGTLPDIKQDDPSGKRGIMFIGSRIRKALGFSSLFIPFLILSLILGCFDYLVLFYAVYNLCWMLLVLTVYTYKATKPASEGNS